MAHAAGNVLLGVALGLSAYYGLTGLLARMDQEGLQEAFAAAGGATGDLEPPPRGLEFEGWAAEDGAYWESLPEGEVFGRLVIERIGLDAVLVKGHSRSDLKRGPGWIGYTDLPGPTGNVGIAGHRTTYGAPFRHIDELAAGDTILLYSPYRIYRYAVSSTQRVTPDMTEVMRTTPDPRLTLSACDPPYSARYRLIVSAELVAVKRTAPTD